MEYGHKGGWRSPQVQGAEGFRPGFIFTPRVVGRLACGELAVEPVLGPVRVAEIKPNGGRSVFVGWRDEHGPSMAAGPTGLIARSTYACRPTPTGS